MEWWTNPTKSSESSEYEFSDPFRANPCPHFKTDDPHTAYLASRDPIADYKSEFKSVKALYLKKEYDVAKSIDLEYVYEVTLVKPHWNDEFVPLKEIKALRLVYAPWGEESDAPERDDIMIRDKTALHTLTRFMSAEGRDIPSDLYDVFRDEGLIPSGNIRVYRGLHFESLSDIPDNLANPHIGQNVTLYDKRAQSWTTNPCAAIAFSQSSGFGLVYSTLLKPKQIIVDTRMINEFQRFTLYSGRQSEIIAKPGEKRASLEFMVTEKGFDITDFGEIKDVYRTTIER
jgi:hypothetical protein